MTTTLIQRLRTDVLWYRRRGNETIAEDCRQAAAALEQQAADLAYVKAASVFNLMEENKRQAAQIAEKDAQIARLKTVMIAAAEEIGAHWDAHCDAEGYGPVNLLRRLEQGIPSEYGYTARAFAHMKAEVEALRADAERLRASAEKVILFNRDHANDQYGDPNKAEAWACVRELRAALRQEQPKGEGA